MRKRRFSVDSNRFDELWAFAEANRCLIHIPVDARRWTDAGSIVRTEFEIELDDATCTALILAISSIK